MKKLSLFIIAAFSGYLSTGQWVTTDFEANNATFLYEVVFPDDHAAYILGEAFESQTMIFKSIDEGLTWDTIHTFQSAFMAVGNLQFMNADTGFVNIGAAIYKTLDGGMTWDTLSLPGTWNDGRQMKITGNNLFVSYNSQDTMYLKMSADMGASWQPLLEHYQSSSGTGWGYQYQFSFTNTFHGVVINPAYLDRMYQTKDGGNTWDTIVGTQGDMNLLPYFHYIDTVNGYIYGAGGMASRTWYRGTPYFHINLDGMDILPVLDMDFKPGLIYASSYYGKIFSSVNTGQIWTPDTTNITAPIVSIVFSNQGNGIAISSHKVLLKRELPSSIMPVSKDMGIKIFPNPTKNTINLQYSNLHIQSLKLTDLSGRVIKTFPAKSKTLEVSGIAEGLYFLQVKAKEGAMVEKVEIR